MKYKIDENTIWEDTGQIRIHNVPPDSKHTFGYVTRVYRQWTKGAGARGYTEVEGNPIYLHEMTAEQTAFVRIAADAMNTISRSLPQIKAKKVKEDLSNISW